MRVDERSEGLGVTRIAVLPRKLLGHRDVATTMTGQAPRGGWGRGRRADPPTQVPRYARDDKGGLADYAADALMASLLLISRNSNPIPMQIAESATLKAGQWWAWPPQFT
jgi:hypothetical protein